MILVFSLFLRREHYRQAENAVYPLYDEVDVFLPWLTAHARFTAAPEKYMPNTFRSEILFFPFGKTAKKESTPSLPFLLRLEVTTASYKKQKEREKRKEKKDSIAI